MDSKLVAALYRQEGLLLSGETDHRPRTSPPTPDIPTPLTCTGMVNGSATTSAEMIGDSTSTIRGNMDISPASMVQVISFVWRVVGQVAFGLVASRSASRHSTSTSAPIGFGIATTS